MRPRDYQRSKVYAWEKKHLPSGRMVPFGEIQDYVNRVWEAEGLKYPPIVKPMNALDLHAGKANRRYCLFPKKGATEHTILHEVAHSLTTNFEDDGDRHGPNFVGMMMKLMEKHLDVSLLSMWHSAKVAKVDFEMFPKYQLLDGLSD